MLPWSEPPTLPPYLWIVDLSCLCCWPHHEMGESCPRHTIASLTSTLSTNPVLQLPPFPSPYTVFGRQELATLQVKLLTMVHWMGLYLPLHVSGQSTPSSRGSPTGSCLRPVDCCASLGIVVIALPPSTLCEQTIPHNHRNYCHLAFPIFPCCLAPLHPIILQLTPLPAPLPITVRPTSPFALTPVAPCPRCPH